jgi:hypothetical protein
MKNIRNAMRLIAPTLYYAALAIGLFLFIRNGGRAPPHAWLRP